MTIEDRK